MAKGANKAFGGPHLAWIPNSVTGANLICGFLSILFSLEASVSGETALYDTACYLVLWATVLDFFDGFLAKATHSASLYGMKMDTFADAVTFGLAPAVLVVTDFLEGNLSPALAWGSAAVFFLCAVWRLARYNVQDASAPSFGFVGLPSPNAAALPVCLYLVTRDAPLAPGAVAAFMVWVGLLMISPLRYPAFKRLLPREQAVVSFLIFTMIVLMLKWSWALGPGQAVARIVLVYFGSFALFWGPLWVPTRHLWNPGIEAEPPIYRDPAAS